VVTAASRERVLGLVDEGADAGAALVVDRRDETVPGHEGGFFVGPCLLDQVRTDMSVYTEEIFGPVLVVLRAATFEDAVEMVNANPYGNGTAVFTNSGEAARRFQRSVTVGMVGVNVPIPVPMAYHSFGGWRDALFGDNHIHGPEGVHFYTRGKVVTSRWPHVDLPGEGSGMHFPTAT
jgi:malonate-semialdehyde dehydrogenase (acetylating)/methylmalonate-semialdehyde dehydrogenase